MARAIVSGELALLRKENQYSQIFLAALNPAIMLACQVNQSFDTHDLVAEISFDSVSSGSYSNVKEGMTLWIGSAAGKQDLGRARIRKAASSSKLYISPTSEITWTNDLYLTVVQDYDFWTIPTQQYESVEILDHEISYAGQNEACKPVPVLGPDAVLWLSDTNVNYEPDASESWVPGSTISSYSWSAPGASSITDGDTATPTISYGTAGTYHVFCTVTTANGASETGVRTVFVFDTNNPPITDFGFSRLNGENSKGGWSVKIDMYQDSSAIQPNTKVILFAKDNYDGQETSLGPLTGSEHILFIGRIDRESIKPDPEQGSLTFEAFGPVEWLKKLAILPNSFEFAETVEKWNQFDSLTVNLVYWQLVSWRSTISRVIDVFPCSDTKSTQAINCTGHTLWDQITDAGRIILYTPLCDRYGQLFLERDAQLLPESERSEIPEVMSLEKQDWFPPLCIERKTSSKTASIEISGTDEAGNELFAIAGGRQVLRFGDIQPEETGLLVSDQDELNTLAGLLLSRDNNPCPTADIDLSANNRFFDIAPRQYILMNLAAVDTERGIVWTNRRLIPRHVSISHDPETGILTVSLSAEAETFESPALTVYREDTAIVNEPDQPDPSMPDYPITPSPLPSVPINPSPFIPRNPDIDDECRNNTEFPANGPFSTGFSGLIDQVSQPALAVMYPFWARSSAYTHKTKYTINGTFWKRDEDRNWVLDMEDDDWYEVYLVNAAGERIATGIHDPITSPYQRTGYFDLPAGTNVDYVEIAINPQGTHVGVASGYGEGFGYSQITNPGVFSHSADSFYSNANLTDSQGQMIEFYGQPSDSNHTITFPIISGNPPFYHHVEIIAQFICGYSPASAKLVLKGNYSQDWKEYAMDGNSITIKDDYTQEYSGTSAITVSLEGTDWPAIEYPGYPLIVNLWATIFPQSEYRIKVSSLLLWNICEYANE